MDQQITNELVYHGAMNIGQRLRQKRHDAGLTLGQVGEYEGITAQYLSDLERGKNQPNTWLLLARLARRYETSADFLLGLDESSAAANGPQAAEIARMWLELDEEQRALVRDMMAMLHKARTPHIIGSQDEGEAEVDEQA